MVRLWVILGVAAVVFTIYAAVDCALFDRSRIRGLPRGWWIVVILLVPIMWFGHTVFLIGLMFGRRIGWIGQTRDDHSVPWSLAARNCSNRSSHSRKPARTAADAWAREAGSNFPVWNLRSRALSVFA